MQHVQVWTQHASSAGVGAKEVRLLSGHYVGAGVGAGGPGYWCMYVVASCCSHLVICY